MDKQNETPATSPVQHEMKEFLAGFERVEAEVRAVPERDLVLVNLDVPSAVATALGAWPEIVQRREEVAALKGADIAKFDKIRDYAFALGHAHSEYRAALGPADPIGTLAEEVTEAREQLFADAQGLGRRGLLEASRVEKLRSGVGYKNVAFDVLGLVGLFRERAQDLAGKTRSSPEPTGAARRPRKDCPGIPCCPLRNNFHDKGSFWRRVEDSQNRLIRPLVQDAI
jgi:hypothetical protein